jgi:hypothetical protein
MLKTTTPKTKQKRYAYKKNGVGSCWRVGKETKNKNI